MPRERKRSSLPKPESDDFADEHTEKVYWSTERLLDEAPETGLLKWRNLYEGWKSVQEEHLEAEETIEEAKQIAWGALAFFILERTNDLGIENKLHEFTRVERNSFVRELNILSSWNEISAEALDEESESFNIEPPNPSLPLKDYPPNQLIEPKNPNSGIYAHLQALDLTSNSKPITPELKTLILSFATRGEEFLEHMIDSRNTHILNTTAHEGQDPRSVARLQETSFVILAIQMVESWGQKGHEFVRLKHLADHLQEAQPQPNPLIDMLDEKVMDERAETFKEEMGISKSREHTISPKIVRRAKKVRVIEKEPFDDTEKSSYVAELTGFKNLDFGAIVNWAPELNYWIGNLMISQASREPPRSTSPIIRILNAETPAQAALGLVEYFQNNLRDVNLPYKTTLSKSLVSAALVGLSHSKVIFRLGEDKILE